MVKVGELVAVRKGTGYKVTIVFNYNALVILLFGRLIIGGSEAYLIGSLRVDSSLISASTYSRGSAGGLYLSIFSSFHLVVLIVVLLKVISVSIAPNL